jgi:hypothetical protein
MTKMLRNVGVVCVIVMLGMLALGRISFAGGGSWLFLLLCPLMHVGMMLFARGACHGKPAEKAQERGMDS